MRTARRPKGFVAAKLAAGAFGDGVDQPKTRKRKRAIADEHERLATGDRKLKRYEHKGHSRKIAEEMFPRGAAEEDLRYNWRRNKGELPPCFIPSSPEGDNTNSKLRRKNGVVLTTAILDTAAAYGYDGAGLGGIRGYFRRYMEEFPQDFFGALLKVLPMTVNHDGEVNVLECRTTGEARRALEARGLGSIDRIFDALVKRTPAHAQPFIDQTVVDVDADAIDEGDRA